MASRLSNLIMGYCRILVFITAVLFEIMMSRLLIPDSSFLFVVFVNLMSLAYSATPQQRVKLASHPMWCLLFSQFCASCGTWPVFRENGCFENRRDSYIKRESCCASCVAVCSQLRPACKRNDPSKTWVCRWIYSFIYLMGEMLALFDQRASYWDCASHWWRKLN